MFDISFFVFLFGCMVFFLPGQLSYGPQEAFFQYGTMALFALSLFVPAKRKVSNLGLALIFAYAILHTVLFSYTETSRYALLNVFFGVVLLKITAERISFNMKLFGGLLLGFCAWNLALIALQQANIDPIYSSVHPENMTQVDVVGFLGSRFCLGILGALALPFVYSYKKWCALCLLPLLYYSKSSSCVIAFFVSFMVVVWFWHKSIFWPLLIASLIAACFYVFRIDMPSGEFGKRLSVWTAGINILKNKMWFGYGLGVWKELHFVGIQGNGQPEEWAWAHNEYMQLWFEQGVIGMGLLFFYFKNLFKYFYLDNDGVIILSAFVGLLIVSFFHFPFHLGKFAGLCVFVLALIEANRAETLRFRELNAN